MKQIKIPIESPSFELMLKAFELSEATKSALADAVLEYLTGLTNESQEYVRTLKTGEVLRFDYDQEKHIATLSFLSPGDPGY